MTIVPSFFPRTLFFLLLIIGLLLPGFMGAQCSGEIGVSGAGCGCLSGCNLTSFGGPNCTGATGNCTAGEVAMSVNITVTAGCTYTVTATMTNRPGCSSSGADAGDQLKVDLPTGVKPFQTGSSNGTLNDSYSLTGPGTVRVSGTANRADEIITYTIAGSAGCTSCNPLPIDLLSFTAKAGETTVKLDWVTGSERNNDFFTIERAGADGVFIPIGIMHGAGNSNHTLYYTNFDSSPLEGASYYRLKQTDYNGAFKYSPIVAVYFQAGSTENVCNAWSCESGLCYAVSGWYGPVEIELYDASGRKIASQQAASSENGTIPLGEEVPGIYIVHFMTQQHQEVRKVRL